MFYSFWGKYQNHSSTLSLAPSMYIPNGNSSLPVVICSHGSFSAERKRFAILSFGCSHFCPVFFDGKPLLGVMLSVVESIWTNCTLQGFLLYYKSPLRNIPPIFIYESQGDHKVDDPEWISSRSHFVFTDSFLWYLLLFKVHSVTGPLL